MYYKFNLKLLSIMVKRFAINALFEPPQSCLFELMILQ